MSIGQKSTMKKLISFYLNMEEPIYQKITLIDEGIHDESCNGENISINLLVYFYLGS